jgi:hypothetical protein
MPTIPVLHLKPKNFTQLINTLHSNDIILNQSGTNDYQLALDLIRCKPDAFNENLEKTVVQECKLTIEGHLLAHKDEKHPDIKVLLLIHKLKATLKDNLSLILHPTDLIFIHALSSKELIKQSVEEKHFMTSEVKKTVTRMQKTAKWINEYNQLEAISDISSLRHLIYQLDQGEFEKLHSENNCDIFMQILYDAYISSLCLPSHAFFKENETKEDKLSRLLAKQAFQSHLIENPNDLLEQVSPEGNFLTLSPYDIEGILDEKKKGEQEYAKLPKKYNPLEEILSKLLCLTLSLKEKTPGESLKIKKNIANTEVKIGHAINQVQTSGSISKKKIDDLYNRVAAHYMAVQYQLTKVKKEEIIPLKAFIQQIQSDSSFDDFYLAELESNETNSSAEELLNQGKDLVKAQLYFFKQNSLKHADLEKAIAQITLNDDEDPNLIETLTEKRKGITNALTTLDRQRHTFWHLLSQTCVKRIFKSPSSHQAAAPDLEEIGQKLSVISGTMRAKKAAKEAIESSKNNF